MEKGDSSSKHTRSWNVKLSSRVKHRTTIFKQPGDFLMQVFAKIMRLIYFSYILILDSCRV